MGQVLLAWILADIITGIVHWYEERYMAFGYKWEVLNEINRDNKLHHMKPTAMLKSTPWENIRYSVYVGVPFALVFYFIGLPVCIWLGTIFACFGNLVHRWSHTPDRQLPRWIKFGQWTGLFIDKQQHDEHHYYAAGGLILDKEDSTRRYCPMSKWNNRWLDAIHFWDFLEWVLGLFGHKPQPVPVRVKNEKKQ